MSYSILRDHISIKNKFKKLFSNNTRQRRRVILINYLDAFTPSIIPDVYNVEIFCYPQPGNIDPYALEELHQKGAKIFFTDPINMNLYYVEKEGFIIGSANYNFTKCALKCFDKIYDILVYIDDWMAIDINIIINSIDSKLIDIRDIEDLKEKHHIFWKTIEGFEYYTNIVTDFKNDNYYIDNNIGIIDKIINKIKKITNFIKIPKQHKSLIKTRLQDVEIESIYGMKAAGETNKQQQNMNIYCVSKEDITEMLINHMRINKRKLH